MDGNITTTAKTETFATEDDIFDLYDEYCHTEMERRDFLTRAAALTLVGGVSGLAMAQALLPRYADAQMILPVDSSWDFRNFALFSISICSLSRSRPRCSFLPSSSLPG